MKKLSNIKLRPENTLKVVNSVQGAREIWAGKSLLSSQTR